MLNKEKVNNDLFIAKRKFQKFWPLIQEKTDFINYKNTEQTNLDKEGIDIIFEHRNNNKYNFALRVNNVFTKFCENSITIREYRPNLRTEIELYQEKENKDNMYYMFLLEGNNMLFYIVLCDKKILFDYLIKNFGKDKRLERRINNFDGNVFITININNLEKIFKEIGKEKHLKIIKCI